jgi:hypothetical protein
MSNELRKQIRGRMNLKETDELLSIWQTNNRVEWSDEAFEEIRKILKERGENIPEQNEPIYEIQDIDDETLNKGLEEWEVKLLDDENQPEFYNTADVIFLGKNIDLTVKAMIFVYLASSLLAIPYFVSLVKGFFPGLNGFDIPIYIFSFVFSIVSAAITIAVTYFPLKALTHILRILMEMEFRSRKAG